MLPSSQFANTYPVPRPAGVLSATPSSRPRVGSNAPMVGSSATLLVALEQARHAARSDADILLEAESGTGKELLAHFIHQESARAAKPFIAINCAAVPEHLLEAELFGHVRGAFTGALASHSGKFELAHGGTLLLDEIGELPPALQPKLLRVLQEREFYRLGDSHPTRVDVRVIASTNQSLQGLVREGRFRQDLYYRLNVIPLSLPPLRERGDDVIELAEYFAAKFAAPQSPPAMSERFRAALCCHYWPGNVRELANAIRRAVALREGDEIDVDALRLGAPPALGPAPWLKPGLSLREAEKALLEITLEATAGNRTRAAALLGVSLRTVRNKIREHGLPPRRML